MDNTKKIMKKITYIGLLLVIGLTILIININNTYSIPSGVTVTFYGNGGKILYYNKNTGETKELTSPYIVENIETYTDPDDDSKFPPTYIRISSYKGYIEGKRFSGWSNGNNKDDVCDEDTNSIQKSVRIINTSDIVLYACYEDIPTVTFTVYGDDTIIDTETGDTGTKETVYSEKYDEDRTTTTISLKLEEFNANRFVANSSGYVFRGWKTNAAMCSEGIGDTVSGIFGGEFGNFDVTYKVDVGRNNFYPCYLEDNGEYKINLDLNGGKIDGKTTYQVQLSSDMQEFDLSTLNVEKKTKDCTDGYEFLGFYGTGGENGQVAYTHLKTWDRYIKWLVVGGVEEGLTAKWGSCKGNTSKWVDDEEKEEKHNVTFEVGTGATLRYNDSVQSKKTFSLSEVTFSQYTAEKDNNKFIGWATYDNKDTCDRSKLKTSSTTKVTEDITYYACYQEQSGNTTKEEYTVTFNTSSCGKLLYKDVEQSKTTFTLSEVNLYEFVALKEGKKYQGWSTSPNNCNKIDASSTITLTKDTTFYACCIDKTNSSGGSNNNSGSNNSGSTNNKELEEIDKSPKTNSMIKPILIVGIITLICTIYHFYNLKKNYEIR